METGSWIIMYVKKDVEKTDSKNDALTIKSTLPTDEKALPISIEHHSAFRAFLLRSRRMLIGVIIGMIVIACIIGYHEFFGKTKIQFISDSKSYFN